MSARTPVRLLLIGTGVRGRVWARVAAESPDVALLVLVDTDTDRAAQIRDELGLDASVSADAHSAISEVRPDVVLVATPPSSHYGLVSEALDAGAHVLCEKPLSEDMAEVRAMVEQAEERAAQLWVGMNFRYLPSSQRIRRYATTGEMGALGHARFTYQRHRDGRRADLNDYPLTMAYPMLLEQSVHHFDLVRHCYRTEVEALVADSWRPRWSTYEGDCCVSVLMQLENGARVNYLGTWTAASNEMAFSWRSDFERGTLTQRAQFDDLVRVDFRPELGLEGPRFKGAGEAEKPVAEALDACVPFVDDTRLLLADFVSSCRGKAEPTTTARDHMRTLALVQACIDSVEGRGWVRLEDVYDTLGMDTARRP
jgi:predicted dehydrogenase